MVLEFYVTIILVQNSKGKFNSLIKILVSIETLTFSNIVPGNRFSKQSLYKRTPHMLISCPRKLSSFHKTHSKVSPTNLERP